MTSLGGGGVGSGGRVAVWESTYDNGVHWTAYRSHVSDLIEAQHALLPPAGSRLAPPGGFVVTLGTADSTLSDKTIDLKQMVQISSQTGQWTGGGD